MSKKTGHRKVKRILSGSLFFLLFFVSGMLAGITVERSGILDNGSVTDTEIEAICEEKTLEEAKTEIGDMDEVENVEIGGGDVADSDMMENRKGMDVLPSGAAQSGAEKEADASEMSGVEGQKEMYPSNQLVDGYKSFVSEAVVRPAAEDNSLMSESEKMNQSIEEQALNVLEGMSCEDKVAQLFFVTPDALTGVSGVTRAGETTREAFIKRPVGGIVLFENNISGPDQLSSFTERLTQISTEQLGVIPFIAVDEEGGTVLRIAKNGSFGLNATNNMSDIGAAGNIKGANDAGSYIGSYLANYGVNVDFAPVADVVSNSENTVVRYRSFGSDSIETAEMVASFVKGLTEYGVCATLKHFPGHGSTSGDSHNGAAVSYRSLEELRANDLVPFMSGVEAGAEFVMAGHICFPNIGTEEDVPATLSTFFLTEILRNEMGFSGIIITDGMNMQAITDYYSSGEAAVMAIKAGADMVLMPADFGDAYGEVLSAVYSGEISEERLDESVLRILKIKLRKMEITR